MSAAFAEMAALAATTASATDFNVLSFASPGQTINDGIGDATAAILAADAAAALFGGRVLFPAGIYKFSSTLTVKRTWIGVPIDVNGKGTILKPTNAIASLAIDLQSEGFLRGIYLDGSSTTGKIGVGIGTVAIANHLGMYNCQVRNFTGANARGIKLAFCVGGWFESVYANGSTINLHSIGFSGGPTTSYFVNCSFVSAVTKGVWMENGYSVKFHSCLFESNGEEGFYMQNVGDNIIGCLIDGDSWFENNWASLPLGAARHLKYALFCDGATGPGGTIRLTIRDTYFNISGTTEKSIRLTNCFSYVIDNTIVFSEAANIVSDGNSEGQFPNWPAQNGDFRTVVSQPNAGAWNSRTHIEDIEGQWTDYVPVVTGSGAMTITGLAIGEACYKINGKTCTVSLSLSFTTATAGAALVNITLPANVRSRSAATTMGCWIDDGAYKDGYAHPNGVSPTSSFNVGRKDLGNWTLGAARAVNFVMTFPLF